MSSLLSLRPHYPFALSFPCPRSLFKPFSLFSSLSSNQTLTLTLTLALDSPLPLCHGPSLFKGRNPDANPNPDQDSVAAAAAESIDKSQFTRVFDISALRVPAEECSALERRIRGHLLNWPRVRNIARVEGDDVDPDLKNLLKNPPSVSEDRLNSLDRKSEIDKEVFSPVLYREKLVKDFNCRGYVNFRNLAKISRPKKKKRRKEGGGEGKERRVKDEIYSVEVVEDEEDEDWSILIGEGFKGGKWSGPTRLLLLDERYAKKGIEEMPEAVKAALLGGPMQNSPLIFELVQCRVTLYYNYWQMNELLEALLPEGIIVPTGFETVGHIAHLNLRDEHQPFKKLIAQMILDKNSPKIRTVVNKIDAIQNDYRTMELDVLAGNHSLVTTVIENGIRFQVDLASVQKINPALVNRLQSVTHRNKFSALTILDVFCKLRYWNSRLATERQRLISCFSNSDVVCDVFSGVGPIAISAAKRVKYVYANDLNPKAVDYLERNIVLNKLDRKIEVSNMDGRRFVRSIFASQQAYNITQVVMNLPKDAAEFLDCFRGIFCKRHKDIGCTLPKIHVYGFSKAENPEFDFHERINMALYETVKEVDMHRVRLVAPGKWMLCASFILPQTVAFAKTSAG